MNTQHFDSIFTTNIRPIFEASHTVINPMNDGDRKHVNEIQTAVATAMNLDKKQTSMFVNYYLHQIEAFGLGYVVPGANGGFVKGPRPVKATPPAPKSEPSVVVNEIINDTIEASPLVENKEELVEETIEEKIAV